MSKQHIKLLYRPRSVFEDFHNRSQRWGVVVAHRRCGKTVACINELIVKALLEGKKDGRYAYVAPYYSQAKKGNTAAAIFWLKTRARWKETQVNEVTGLDGKDFTISWADE